MSSDFGSIGATGITKEEHDELVAAKGRLLTQGPMKRRTVALPDDFGGFSIIDEVRAAARMKGQDK